MSVKSRETSCYTKSTKTGTYYSAQERLERGPAYLEGDIHEEPRAALRVTDRNFTHGATADEMLLGLPPNRGEPIVPSASPLEFDTLGLGLGNESRTFIPFEGRPTVYAGTNETFAKILIHDSMYWTPFDGQFAWETEMSGRTRRKMKRSI